MAEPFIGEIKMVGFNYAPPGWLECNGSLQPITTYQALYALLGTNFGGNGTSNFGIPDFRGRVPMSYGTGPGITTKILGQTGGLEYVTLSIQEMPTHTHEVTYTAPEYGISGTVKPKAYYAPGSQTSIPTNNYLASINDGFSTSENVTMGDSQVNLSIVNTTPGSVIESAKGGSNPHYNLQPFTVINFIIAWDGLWPSRT